jgi:hypothetical protein
MLATIPNIVFFPIVAAKWRLEGITVEFELSDTEFIYLSRIGVKMYLKRPQISAEDFGFKPSDDI